MSKTILLAVSIKSSPNSRIIFLKNTVSALRDPDLKFGILDKFFKISSKLEYSKYTVLRKSKFIFIFNNFW